MNSIPVAACVIAALCFTVACAPSDRLKERDAQARIDDSGESRPGEPIYDKIFEEGSVGDMLEKHLVILATPGETQEAADALYALSLKEIRANANASADALVRAYQAIDASRYFDRWAIVKTLSDLETPAAYEVLAGIARSRLPAENSRNTHYYSTVEEEIMIRLRAVEGVALLATNGHKQANQDLAELATGTGQVNSAVQRRAIKFYLRIGQDYDRRAEELRGKLPQYMHELVTLQTTDQSVFHERAQALTTLAEENTLLDPAEEQLPSEESPRVSDKKERAQ